MNATTNRGWGWPLLSKKAHYFINGLALCRRWAYAGPLERGKDDSPDNCAACRKILAKSHTKRQEKGTP